uniref:Uncharacterized protein n=1 Tax=Arundo donax TaxID=35708 RepID=A0A0A9AFI1_ARUDO
MHCLFFLLSIAHSNLSP